MSKRVDQNGTVIWPSHYFARLLSMYPTPGTSLICSARFVGENTDKIGILSLGVRRDRGKIASRGEKEGDRNEVAYFYSAQKCNNTKRRCRSERGFACTTPSARLIGCLYRRKEVPWNSNTRFAVCSNHVYDKDQHSISTPQATFSHFTEIHCIL